MVLKGAKLYGSLLACSLAFGPLGCGKAKEALENELGISQLSDEEIETMKTDAGGLGDNIEVSLGFNITDNFDGDFGSTKAYDLPFLPENLKKGADASGDNQNLLLLRELKFSTGQAEFTRFQIVNVAEVTEDNKLSIAGDTFNANIDEDKRVNKANGQSGKYLLVKSKDAANSFAFLQGTVNLDPQTGDNKPVPGSLVFTDSSPFVTESGSSGKYLLAMFKGSKGYVTGFARDGFPLAAGTPKTTTTEIAYAGAIPQDKIDEAAGKADGFSGGSGEKVANWAEAANEKLTPFFGGWQVQEANLLFIEPKKDPPAPPAQAADAKPPVPTPDLPADPPPPEDSPVIRKPEAETDNDKINVDLGCSGARDDDTGTPTLTTDGAKFETFEGWRGLGDVRITVAQHEAIFGNPQTGDLAGEERYLDETTGYCLISTGDGQHQKDTTATQLAPKDGKTSEMWQPLSVPAEAVAIQIRYAFFTQEAPNWVGSGFNDSFFVKFDESPDFLASGNLNDLAGEAVTGCPTKWAAEGCGEWQPIKADAATGLNTGVLWDIESSMQATGSSSLGCGGDKCFHGWIAPRVICKTLPAEVKGKTMTLRMSVSDAGDSYYDSAFAVDSIVFSKEGCAEDDLFSPDDRSPVGDQG